MFWAKSRAICIEYGEEQACKEQRAGTLIGGADYEKKRYHIALDKYDKNIVINALNTLRTRQLQEERPTEPVDELISKVAHAPTKKVKVVHCRCNEER